MFFLWVPPPSPSRHHSAARRPASTTPGDSAGAETPLGLMAGVASDERRLQDTLHAVRTRHPGRTELLTEDGAVAAQLFFVLASDPERYLRGVRAAMDDDRAMQSRAVGPAFRCAQLLTGESHAGADIGQLKREAAACIAGLAAMDGRPHATLEQEVLEQTFGGAQFGGAQSPAEVRRAMRGRLLELEAMAATGSRVLPGDGNLRLRDPALHAENTFWMYAVAVCVTCSAWSRLGWWALAAGIPSLMIAPIAGSIHDEAVRPVSLFLCGTLLSTFLVGATAYGGFVEDLYDGLATWPTSLAIAAGAGVTVVVYAGWLTLVDSGGGITALLAILCVVTAVEWRIKGFWTAVACAAASFAAAVATVGRIHRFVELVRGAAWIDAGSLNRFEAGLVYGQRG